MASTKRSFRMAFVWGTVSSMAWLFSTSMPAAWAGAPAAPSALSAKAVAGLKIQLQWIDNSANETGFIIQRSPQASAGFATIARLAPASTAFIDGGLSDGMTYFYRVQAYTANRKGVTSASAFSNVASAIAFSVAVSPSPTASPSPAAPAPAQRIYGVTITNPWNQLPQILTSLKNLAHKPTARVVFDEFVPASDYQSIVSQIHGVAGVMGEILDSAYVKQYTVSDYVARTTEYVDALGSNVDIWEIGNEINGEWLGTPSSVVAKMTGAYDLVKARGLKTALTLYYNQGCWSNSANEMFTWATANVPDRMKQGLDYVLVSFYEDDCNGIQPDWPAVFQKLGQIFPNSLLGFGETGTIYADRKATYINRYYKMVIDHPRYIFGDFWWYFDASQNGGAGDMVPYTNTLWGVLNKAIQYVPSLSPSLSTTSADWQVAYDGYGSVTFDASTGIVLQPKAATSPTETHAALVLATKTQSQPVRDFRVTVKVTTEQQLRTPTPNAWEVFWLFFNYTTDAVGKKKTNYFTFKPNGVELGTAFDEIGQTFLATRSTPSLVIGVPNTISILKRGQHLEASIDGKLVLTYDGGTAPNALYDVLGSIGLYTEDARVRIHSVTLDPL